MFTINITAYMHDSGFLHPLSTLMVNKPREGGEEKCQEEVILPAMMFCPILCTTAKLLQDLSTTSC